MKAFRSRLVEVLEGHLWLLERIPVEDLDGEQVVRHEVVAHLVKHGGPYQLALEQASEEVIVVPLAGHLALLLQLLRELGGRLDEVERGCEERADLDRADVGLVQELVVGRDLDLPAEVGAHYQQLLGRPHAEGHVLGRVRGVGPLLVEAGEHLRGVQAVQAVVVEEQEVARVQRLLDLGQRSAVKGVRCCLSGSPS